MNVTLNKLKPVFNMPPGQELWNRETAQVNHMPGIYTALLGRGATPGPSLMEEGREKWPRTVDEQRPK